MGSFLALSISVARERERVGGGKRFKWKGDEERKREKERERKITFFIYYKIILHMIKTRNVKLLKCIGILKNSLINDKYTYIYLGFYGKYYT